MNAAEYNRFNVKRWRLGSGGDRGQPWRKSASKMYRDAIVDFLVKRDGCVCGICKEALDPADCQINHKLAASLGGEDTLENFELAHPTCNNKQALAIRKQKHGY